MLIASIRIVGLGPFDDLVFRMTDQDGRPRNLVAIVGGAGVGKTSLLSAIASTRPGYAVAQGRTRSAEPGKAGFVVADWMLGDDDPARPHALRVASPNVVLDEAEDVSQLRRREQALFDRKATERGFALLALSAARWFSRSPVVLTSPGRTVFRYDVRAGASFDDASRADLGRETKQALSHLSVAAALASRVDRDRMLEVARDAVVGELAMREVVGGLTMLAGYRYVGADPVSLEPTFEDRGGASVEFDHLPTSARHLAAIGALTVKTLLAAWPGQDPREGQGVVLIDDVALHQEHAVLAGLAPALKQALPRVQWILTTSSLDLASGCEPSEILALRRMPASHRIELYEGPLAMLH